MKNVFSLVLCIASLSVVVACGGGETTTTEPATPDATDVPDQPAVDPKVDFGVDLENKVLRIGTLNDESGPAAAIGKPYALGKRVLVAQVNAGGSGLLPDGWTIELIEKDHGYNPQASVQAFKEIKGDVLFIGTSFGTPNTLPLVPMLEEEGGMVAFPASLSSQMAADPHTPPAAASYVIEARRAMDWVVELAGEVDTAKAGIIYQQDDYGQDGITGWKAAAELHGVTIVSEQTIAPGQKDFTAVVSALKEAGATHVLLTTLPSATGPILGTAAQLKYMPVWVGNTPAWVDKFFEPTVIPSVVFTNFYWATSLPIWGDEGDGMATFIAGWEAHAGDARYPDFYTMVSWIQGRVALQAFSDALAEGDVTRAGFLTALQGIDGYDLGGMMQPVSYTSSPYVVGTKVRVLKPDFEGFTWTEEAPFAEPAQ